jgi:hypothetical protein
VPVFTVVGGADAVQAVTTIANQRFMPGLFHVRERCACKAPDMMICVRGSMLVVLAGCLGPPPREPTPPPAPPPKAEKKIMLGGVVTMSAGWADTCSRAEWEWTGGKSEHDSPDIPTLGRTKTYYRCNEQQFDVQVKCSIKCELTAPDDATYNGSAAIDVRALEVGLLVVELELINAKTLEHRTTTSAVDVVAPDSFRLLCFTPRKAWDSCDGGISAEQPMFRVFAYSETTIHKSSLLRVNGRPAPKGTNFTTGVPLAAFLADASATAVAPGSYTIDVSIGAKQSTFTLDAR